MEIISFLIHAYLYLYIYELLTEESQRSVKYFYIFLFGVTRYITELSMYTSYLWPFIVLTLLVSYSICVHSRYSNLENFKYAIVVHGIDFIFSMIMGSILGVAEGLFQISEINWRYIYFGIARTVFIVVLYKKRITFTRIKQTRMIYICMIATLVLLFSEQIIRLGYMVDNHSYVYIGVPSIYVAALFTTLWLLDHHKMQKIQNEYAADNKQMSQKLHRSKEILPLLADYVSNIDESENEKMRGKLQEVCHDYGKELSGQELNSGLFNSTGVELLDLLLQKKMSECNELDIEFNVFVNTRIDDDMKRLGINDGELIRMMGDLLRNAVNAVEESDSPEAMILVIVARGMQGQVEIHVHDSGVPFPDEVLQKLGERGNTTWGTGNGIADLMETLRRVQASIEIIPEPDPDDEFTKEICIRFDGAGLVITEHGQFSA